MSHMVGYRYLFMYIDEIRMVTLLKCTVRYCKFNCKNRKREHQMLIKNVVFSFLLKIIICSFQTSNKFKNLPGIMTIKDNILIYNGILSVGVLQII